MAAVFWSVTPAAVFNGLLRFPLDSLCIVFALLFGNLRIVSLRLWRILSHFGHAVPWPVACRATVAGHLAGLFFMSLSGQVVGRQAW